MVSAAPGEEPGEETATDAGFGKPGTQSCGAGLGIGIGQATKFVNLVRLKTVCLRDVGRARTHLVGKLRVNGHPRHDLTNP